MSRKQNGMYEEQGVSKPDCWTLLRFSATAPLEETMRRPPAKPRFVAFPLAAISIMILCPTLDVQPGDNKAEDAMDYVAPLARS